MIITRVTGGLGNQMFQYAIGRKLSLLNKTNLLLDVSIFESHPYRKFQLDLFNIHAEIAQEKDKKYIFKKLPFGIRRIDWELQKRFSWYTRIFLEPFPPCYYPFVLKATNNSYLQGWWQSYKYFEDIRDVLLAEFTLKNSLSDQSKKILEHIKNSNCSISVHIRRGDYINIPEIILTPYSFYQQAISFFEKRYSDISLFMFSDDMAWVKSKFSLDFPHTFVENNYISPSEDLILISNCKHNIIANSTFSWWAAYLNQNSQKIILTPQKWFADEKRNQMLDNLLPKNWLKF